MGRAPGVRRAAWKPSGEVKVGFLMLLLLKSKE